MHEQSKVAAPTEWHRLAMIGIGLSLVVAVILLAFSWPAVTAKPHDLPVGIVGTEQ